MLLTSHLLPLMFTEQPQLMITAGPGMGPGLPPQPPPAPYGAAPGMYPPGAAGYPGAPGPMPGYGMGGM